MPSHNGGNWSEADKAELVRLDSIGTPVPVMAERFNCSAKAIHQMRHRLGLTKPRQSQNMLAVLESLVRETGVNKQTGFVAYRSLSYCTAGLTSEAGEVAGEYKKILRNDMGNLTPERKEKLLEEVGDVLWYVQALCIGLKKPLSEVIQNLHSKLTARMEADEINERIPGT